MMKITNLTGSPHQLRTMSGKNVMLPAFGSIEGEFTDEYLHLLSVCGSVRVDPIESEPRPDPVETEPEPEAPKRRSWRKANP